MKTLPKKKKVETVHSIFILASKAPLRLAESTYLIGVGSKMTPWTHNRSRNLVLTKVSVARLWRASHGLMSRLDYKSVF